MSKANYVVLKDTGGTLVKAWIKGVSMEGEAERQLRNVAKMPFIHKWVAAMPDVHFGKGANSGHPSVRGHTRGGELSSQLRGA